MKLLKAAIICSALLTTTAQAQDFCTTIAKTATSIMQGRQIGVPMSNVMTLANQPHFTDVAKLLKSMVVEAYEQPRFSSKAHQDRAVTEFSNKQMLACMRATK